MAEPFLGQINLVGWNFAARGWALCQNQLLPIAQNTALFSLLGTLYGGDGRTTFGLPDLQGRVAKGWGAGAGLNATRTLGQKGGSESVTLTTGNLPSHNHSPALFGETSPGSAGSPAGNILGRTGSNPYAAPSAAAEVPMASDSVKSNNVGGSQPFPIDNPYIVLNYQIALTGIFPSRS